MSMRIFAELSTYNEPVSNRRKVIISVEPGGGDHGGKRLIIRDTDSLMVVLSLELGRDNNFYLHTTVESMMDTGKHFIRGSRVYPGE